MKVIILMVMMLFLVGCSGPIISDNMGDDPYEYLPHTCTQAKIDLDCVSHSMNSDGLLQLEIKNIFEGDLLEVRANMTSDKCTITDNVKEVGTMAEGETIVFSWQCLEKPKYKGISANFEIEYKTWDGGDTRVNFGSVIFKLGG